MTGSGLSSHCVYWTHFMSKQLGGATLLKYIGLMEVKAGTDFITQFLDTFKHLQFELFQYLRQLQLIIQLCLKLF